MITATEVSANDGLQRFQIDVVTETIGYLTRCTTARTKAEAALKLYAARLPAPAWD
jgi:hypothetical protein